MKIDFHSPANSKAIGYGRAYHEIRDNLIKQGADLAELYTGAEIQIYMGTPIDELSPYFQRKSDKFLIYTMWESSKPIPEIIRNMELFDGIITPSKWCEQVYRGLGYTKPIYIVPLGINPNDWEYTERRRKEDCFTILWQGTYIETKYWDKESGRVDLGFGDRKGSNLVIEAFRELALPHSQLFLKTNPRYTLKNLNHNVQMADDILLLGSILNPDELKSMIAFSDVSVYPSYCEGFGLIPLEHMASGLPLIVANNTGMQEFIDSRYMIPIDCQEIQGVMGWDTGKAFEPDKEQIKKAILWVYEHPEEANAMAKAASDWVKTNFTYERSAKMLMEAVNGFAKR